MGETYGETLEEQRETLAMIHRQADKMSQLIDQLLRITRLDQGTELARRERGGSGPPWPGRCVPRAPGPRIA